MNKIINPTQYAHIYKSQYPLPEDIIYDEASFVYRVFTHILEVPVLKHIFNFVMKHRLFKRSKEYGYVYDKKTKTWKEIISYGWEENNHEKE
jgi:hypothetical protein